MDAECEVSRSSGRVSRERLLSVSSSDFGAAEEVGDEEAAVGEVDVEVGGEESSTAAAGGGEAEEDMVGGGGDDAGWEGSDVLWV